MKRSVRVHSLVDFLRVESPSLDSICKFLVLDTFYEFSATSFLVAVVRADGTVHKPADFGFDPHIMKDIAPRSVVVDTPMNRALRTGEIVDCGSFEEFDCPTENYGPIMFPHGFSSSIAFPIPQVGIGLFFSSDQVNLTPDTRQFLAAIGGVLALRFSQPEYREKMGYLSDGKNQLVDFALTSRQLIILGAMRRGLTNSMIASELEFSESLIRQETVQIYRKMGVSGRKELLSETISDA
ncbi:MAG: LuxR C-terminal-related transcriptional regulator [Candidatus Nanopelagicaceae bacterium]